MKSLALVVPVWNAPQLALRLAGHLSGLKEVARALNFELQEAIFVDDGSLEPLLTAPLQSAAGDVPVRVLRNLSNRGKGYSVRRGVLAAASEWVLMSDVDESTPLTEFAQLAKHLDAALICGSRRSDDERPLYRRILSRIFHWLSGVKTIHDTQCGFKLFDRARLLDAFVMLETERFAFDVELVNNAPSVAEVAVIWHGGKRSSLRILRDGPRMLMDLRKIRAKKKRCGGGQIQKSIHFVGVGGVGMAALAYLLKKSGACVSGCDLEESPRTKWLEKEGIDVLIGHAPKHITENISEVIITPAVPKDNPEYQAARAAEKAGKLRVRMRGDVLAEVFNKNACGIAVCGTHGKTTTATFTTKLLSLLGDNPAWCIGGECGDQAVAGVGSGPLVVEADESDGTLAKYRAAILVVTSLDYDHPDHFKTYDEYLACYKTAISHAQKVIYAKDLHDADWPILKELVMGSHNISNARAAIEVALARGYTRAQITAALPRALALLPDRRFECVRPPSTAANDFGFSVYTDYAHHPAELKCAIAMAAEKIQKRGGKGRVRVLFQPHRYSRTKILLEEFPPAFAAADEVVLVPVYPAFEEPLLGGDIADLYAAFRRANIPRTPQSLFLARSPEEAWKHLYLSRKPEDLVLIAGAGNVVCILPMVRAGSITPGSVYPIGMCSNTWRSDLTTNDVYVPVPPDFPTAISGSAFLDKLNTEGIHDLDFMDSIPGTLGGWLACNAGAHGHAIGEKVKALVVAKSFGKSYNPNDSHFWEALPFQTIPAKECGFSYRRCEAALGAVIKDVQFTFTPETTSRRLEYRKKRRIFPAGTKGSVFKNPPHDSAGRLLEEAGAKSLRVGGAYVWEEHANVIVANSKATPSDILALARLMKAAVQARFGITLEAEVRGLSI